MPVAMSPRRRGSARLRPRPRCACRCPRSVYPCGSSCRACRRARPSCAPRRLRGRRRSRRTARPGASAASRRAWRSRRAGSVSTSASPSSGKVSLFSLAVTSSVSLGPVLTVFLAGCAASAPPASVSAHEGLDQFPAKAPGYALSSLRILSARVRRSRASCRASAPRLFPASGRGRPLNARLGHFVERSIFRRARASRSHPGASGPRYFGPCGQRSPCWSSPWATGTVAAGTARRPALGSWIRCRWSCAGPVQVPASTSGSRC